MLPNRYTCQIKLPGFGQKAQAKLKKSKVLLVGVGGLGSPAAQYLVSAGIGQLDIVDADRVEQSNLHRQVLFENGDVGELKAVAAARNLNRQNPEVSICPMPMRVTSSNVSRLVEPYDVVLDCTDNYESRLLLNDACVMAGKPLVYGGAYQYMGQVSVWNALNPDGTRGANYRDVFPLTDYTAGEDCSDGGVIPTLTGVIGTMQANEVIKYLAHLPGVLAGRLLVFDSLTMQSRVIDLPAVTLVNINTVKTNVPTISVAELKAALPSHKYELVDVRSPGEHKSFNFGGRLIPLENILSGDRQLDTKKPVVFYCRSGRRSAMAVLHYARSNPRINALSLEGGVQAWQLNAELAYG